MTPLTYDWLLANGFHKIDKHERQPTEHVRYCIGMHVIGDRFMVAPEDLCIDLCPLFADEDKGWHLWVTYCAGPNNFPCRWIGVRTIHYADEVIALYESLTGRKYSNARWDQRKLGEPLFPDVRMYS